jgi:hypothetical protein
MMGRLGAQFRGKLEACRLARLSLLYLNFIRIFRLLLGLTGERKG